MEFQGIYSHSEKLEKDYLLLQTCLQRNVGTCLESNQVLTLMESTRNPTKRSIITKLVFCVLAIFVFQLGLYVLDVVTDSLVALDYYKKWTDTNLSSDICFLAFAGGKENTTITLSDYPSCLTYCWKFSYTMLFMFLPSLFYLIETRRHLTKSLAKYFGRGNSLTPLKNGMCMILLPILAVLWPVILFFRKAYLLIGYQWKTWPERLKDKGKFERVSNIVLIVHLCEVCVQSSFNAVLQWYIVFPEFISYFQDHVIANEELNSSVMLSSISFLVSILSLARSFTSYSAEQKDGALDLSWNPPTKMTTLSSTAVIQPLRIAVTNAFLRMN